MYSSCLPCPSLPFLEGNGDGWIVEPMDKNHVDDVSDLGIDVSHKVQDKTRLVRNVTPSGQGSG